MNTGKTKALIRRIFVSKVMSLLLNTLSRLVIAFLPRSKCLLISWLQSPTTVIWETKKIKSVTIFIVSPSTCHELMGKELVCCSVSSSNCCFLTCIHISQETGQVVWYSHLLNFPRLLLSTQSKALV